MGNSPREWTPTLTERETVLFDLKGYILFPAVLREDELAPIKAQCEKWRTDKASLPPAARCLPGGPASVLIDHPAVMRVLHTIIDDEVEKIRLEGAFLSYRFKGDNLDPRRAAPGPVFCVQSHQCAPPQTRVYRRDARFTRAGTPAIFQRSVSSTI